VEEQIDLSDFLGQEIWIQFLMSANNNNVTGDGFFFDDLAVEVAYQGVVATNELEAKDFTLYQNRPNPAKDYTIIEFTNKNVNLNQARLQVFDVLGALVYEETISEKHPEHLVIQTHDWGTGIYFYRVVIDNRASPTRRMEVIR